MHLVGVDEWIEGFELHVERTTDLCYLQREGVDHVLCNLVSIKLLHLQCYVVVVEEAHLQDFLYLIAKATCFAVDDVAKSLISLFALVHTLVCKHLRSDGNGRDRRLELVCHVVHEVILHFADALLPYNKVYGDERRDEQNDGKAHCWSHIACNALDELLLVREVYDDCAHLSHRITTEECLLVAWVYAFLCIILASIDFSAIACIDNEVEG